jgi:putative DNA primase/helicase
MHLEPPEMIEPGRLYRFPGVGKSNGNTAGWCRLFDDGQGGCFGDWSSGFSQNWHAKRDSQLTPSELTVFKRRIAETRALVEKQRQEKAAQAAEKAIEIWNTAEAAKPDHPYLISKHIEACGARQHQGALVIPVRSDGKLCSLQFIATDGSKRFLSGGQVSGGYCSIGATKEAHALCVVEGFATGATIHQATGYPVEVAFHAGNLASVAKAMRKRFPDLPLIVCADDDAATEGNPGITKASHAANVTGAKLALPRFGDQRPEGTTDFNDMAALTGLESAAEISKAAVSVEQRGEISLHDWPEPLPLSAKIDPEPYPLDALPDTLRMTVEEVLAFTKAPISLVASSGLAALSLAVQVHADVKRAEKLSGTVGLFLLTLADSGERKSTCDSFFMQAIREYEANQTEEAKPLVKDHKAAMDAWEAKRGGIKDKIRALAKAGKSSQEQDAELCDLEYDKPEPPRVPRLIYGDATPEALKWNLAMGWPSGGVVSSEAGLVFGAHGMGKESVMRNLATLNQLWDGADIATERRTSESFTVRGARLTIALQVQEATLRSFIERSGGLARGTGFLARFLVAWPESTQGYRPFTDPPETWPALAKFNQRLAEILNQPVPIDEDGALSPTMIPLATDTKAAWIAFHDAIESELRYGGEYMRCATSQVKQPTTRPELQPCSRYSNMA